MALDQLLYTLLCALMLAAAFASSDRRVFFSAAAISLAFGFNGLFIGIDDLDPWRELFFSTGLVIAFFTFGYIRTDESRVSLWPAYLILLEAGILLACLTNMFLPIRLYHTLVLILWLMEIIVCTTAGWHIIRRDRKDGRFSPLQRWPELIGVQRTHIGDSNNKEFSK